MQVLGVTCPGESTTQVFEVDENRGFGSDIKIWYFY